MSMTIKAALLAAGLLAATPADAQYGKDRGRSGRVASDIARTIEEAADAIGTVTGAVETSVDGVRYRREERRAVDRCAPRVERYGRMQVSAVRPYERRSMRVYGTVQPDSRYQRSGDARAFTCTVRDDGRVKLNTQRLG